MTRAAGGRDAGRRGYLPPWTLVALACWLVNVANQATHPAEALLALAAIPVARSGAIGLLAGRFKAWIGYGCWFDFAIGAFYVVSRLT